MTNLAKGISILIVIMLSTGAFAQKEVNIAKIEIKENRLSIPFSESTRSLDIITSMEIKSSGAASINELLQNIGGIDIRRRGANGVQADISFRGSTFEQVLVLINGVKIVDPQTSHHVLNLPLDLDIIQRIEVVKGPAGRIYGQGAFAGAVNIVTKNPDKTRLTLEGTYGKYGLLGGKLTGNIKKKKLSTYLSYQYEETDPGYRKYADYMRHNVFLQSEYRLKKASIDFTSAYVNNGFGANSFYAAPGDSASYENVNTLFANLRSSIPLKSTTLNPAIYIRYNTDHYVYNRENPSIYENNHRSTVSGIQLNATTLLAKSQSLGYGIEYRNDQLISDNLGDRSRNVVSANLEYKAYLFDDKFKIIPGVNYNYYSDFGSNFLAGIDLSYNLTKKLSIFGNTGNTYRIPSYTELYYEDFSNVGNSNLKAEKAMNYEAGLKFISKKYFYQVSYFRREGTDIIDWIQSEVMMDSMNTLKWVPGNYSNLNTEGIDVSSTIQFGKINFLSPLRKIRVNYTYISADLSQLPNENSRYALEHINHQFNISSHWSFLNILKFSSAYRYVNRVEFDPYGVWDFSLGFHRKKWQINANIQNAFDRSYSEYEGIPMPRRWGRISAKIILDK